MNYTKRIKILMFLMPAAIIFALNTQVSSQNVSVNETTIENSSSNNTNVITIEGTSDEKTKVENKNNTNAPVENAVYSKDELTGGNWVLTDQDAKSFNGVNITKWETTENDLIGHCSWKDVLDIIHTVESDFKWQTPPKNMQPGSYLNIEAVYTNIDYSTTAQVYTGIKMYFAKTGTDYRLTDPNAIEVLKLNKDNKHYANEVKKGFYYAPKYLFDNTNTCQLIVDCYVGKDHYITTYTYTYQP